MLVCSLLVHCNPGEQVGSETHFLRLCPDGTCASGDQCVCGVCTVACADVDACDARLSKDGVSGVTLTCRAPLCEEPGDAQAAPGAVCDVICQKDEDCEPMGSDYECQLQGSDGSCRSRAPVSGPVSVNRCGGNRIEVAGGTLLAADDSQRSVLPFCLDRSELSVSSYTLCVNSGSCTAPGAGNYFVRGRDNHPINGITLEQASGFCESIGARLPSSFEWQWAAQGGELAHAYPWGNAAPTADATQVCALDEASQDTCPELTHEAGQTAAGFADLSGNVAELVTTDTEACVAGGSFEALTASELTTTSCEPYAGPSLAIGFRCAAAVP